VQGGKHIRLRLRFSNLDQLMNEGKEKGKDRAPGEGGGLINLIFRKLRGEKGRVSVHSAEKSVPPDT